MDPPPSLKRNRAIGSFKFYKVLQDTIQIIEG